MKNRLEHAKKIYANWGVDVDEALAKLKDFAISIHCWQGDDVRGFEDSGTEADGGIAVTGNHPGRAGNPDELMDDIKVALKLIPGKHRLNLHAMYLIDDNTIPRDKIEPWHFKKWLDFAHLNGLALDINPSLFSHKMASDGLTLSHPDEKVRRFWIDHCKATRRIATHFSEELNTQTLHNIWIPDGYKDTPGDRLGPRRRLMESLDEILYEKYNPAYIVDSVESKLFGIGVESYTVGSHEFYLNYAARKNIVCCLDTGHFHPTESVADKISSMLLFSDKLALHVSRGVRWDSDHVVAFSDELKDLACAIVSCDAMDKVFLGLDFFDATINRIAAWVLGVRNMQKAMLYALLTPHGRMKNMQDSRDFTSLLVMHETLKEAPFSDVWDSFCESENVPQRDEWLGEVLQYEQEILGKRT